MKPTEILSKRISNLTMLNSNREQLFGKEKGRLDGMEIGLIFSKQNHFCQAQFKNNIEQSSLSPALIRSQDIDRLSPKQELQYTSLPLTVFP